MSSGRSSRLVCVWGSCCSMVVIRLTVVRSKLLILLDNVVRGCGVVGDLDAEDVRLQWSRAYLRASSSFDSIFLVLRIRPSPLRVTWDS